MMSTMNRMNNNIVALGVALLALAVVSGQAAQFEPKDPSSVVAQLDAELAELEANLEKKVTDRYTSAQETASELIEQGKAKEGAALKAMANLFVNIEQIRFSTRRMGLQVAKSILQDQFLQAKPSARPDLKIQREHAQLLVVRATLRSLVDASRYGDVEWRKLYALIDKFVAADKPQVNAALHQLATEAHESRFKDQSLAYNVYFDQEKLLKELGQDDDWQETLLKHLDNVLDAASKCGAQCLKLADDKDELNFYTYPLVSEEAAREAAATLEALEAGQEAIGVAAADVDDEDIGLQGMEFLAAAGKSLEQFRPNL